MNRYISQFLSLFCITMYFYIGASNSQLMNTPVISYKKDVDSIQLHGLTPPSLLWNTFLGETESHEGNDIAVDVTGWVFDSFTDMRGIRYLLSSLMKPFWLME